MLSLLQIKQYGDDIAEDVQKIGNFGECLYRDFGKTDNFSRCHSWSMLGVYDSVELFLFFYIFEKGPILVLSCQTGILRPVFHTVYEDTRVLKFHTRTTDVSIKMLVGLHDGLVRYLKDVEGKIS